MDQTEVSYYEANLVYNIMVINMAYVTIPMFKRQKRAELGQILRILSQSQIV